MSTTTQEYFRAREAAALLRIGLSTYWKWVSDGRIPRGLKIGPRVTVWPVGDLEALLKRDGRHGADDVR